ncbi:MAG: hypothetical protein OES38_08390 [Gammaproteobacteria bacterium]|nr:hypothetical protein [Gammaproteobacteria bacterium]
MSSTITVKRISGSTTFKVLFVGFICFHVVTTLLAAILVLIGVLPLELADPASIDAMTPLLILGTYLLVGVLFSPIWVGFFWVSIWPGVWLYSLFRNMELGYVPSDEQPHA